MPTQPLDVTPYAISLLSAAILALLGYLIQRWLKNRPSPPSIPEMWERLDHQDKRIEALERERAEDKRLLSEMETHIAELEKRIPDPPGVPPRPWVVRRRNATG